MNAVKVTNFRHAEGETNVGPLTGDSGGRNADFARLFRRRHEPACDMPVVFEKAGSEQERRVVDPTTGDAFEGCEQDVLSAVREHYAAQCWEIELDLTEAWANEPGVGDAYARFATDEIVAHVRDNWDTPEPSED
jgi:hypothetical protein